MVLICDKTYSLVWMHQYFKYLIILIAQEALHLHLMDDVTSYLYDSLKNDMYMKIHKGFNLSNKENSKEDYSIKLNKSPY